MSAIKFIKNPLNPVISRKYDTFYSVHAANPDIIEYEDKFFLYFRGQGIGGHDQIGLAYCQKNEFDGVHWQMHENNPIIKVDNGIESFDNEHILDPAAIIVDKKVFLYYSGHSKNKKYSIGLAVSDDGINFYKSTNNPVIQNAISPEIVYHDGLYFLFYSKMSKKGNFDIFVSKSIDGINFDVKNEIKVFSPSYEENSFDKFSISTVRILKEREYFYMVYGGCDKYFDYPLAFGLARSCNLIEWERYSHNPIMERGLPGEWDEGALWFGTMHKVKSDFYLWYEGVGAGLGINTPEGIECSMVCRNEDYGGYRKFSFSQIGLAKMSGELKWE
jgi:predicted GH43/DUF377 family glycosyl hydrolase